MDHQNEIQHPWLALMGPIIGRSLECFPKLH